ncbi:MAG: glutamate ligase domain-containing protein [Minisyncoccota bacterium]
MKRILKSIVAFKLALLARAVIRRYRPRIVMVSGSVGKTSTKDAVAETLTARFLVRKSEKSFNSEFGVPFTILGVKNPWSDPFAWFSIVKSALALLLLPNHYPNMLVLEVGADRPGDLARILRIATPDLVVITRLPEIPVHVEAYASPEEVREEEFSPAYALAAAAPLIIPADDPYTLDCAMRIPARSVLYGESDDAVVHISDIDFYESEGKVSGMTAKVRVAGENGSIVVRGSIGKTQILPAAAALATAHALEIPLAEALAALEGYEPPPGRGRLLSGKNGSIIIDDSYNASPAAVEEALATLKAFPRAQRRIAILGDMLELGRYSVMEHERIGALASESADMIIAVGIRARAFAAAPRNGKTLLFDNSLAATSALADLVQVGDVVLVKGSQSIRTERIVEALLADPSDATRLVRQEKEWKLKL